LSKYFKNTNNHYLNKIFLFKFLKIIFSAPLFSRRRSPDNGNSMYGSQTQSGHGFGQPNAGRGYQVKILGRANLASPVFI